MIINVANYLEDASHATIRNSRAESGQIHEEEDITSRTGRVLTDGCGRISVSLAERVAKHLGLGCIPAAFQARIGPCKGMWLVDLHLERDSIEIRRSMRKWDVDWASCNKEDQQNQQQHNIVQRSQS